VVEIPLRNGGPAIIDEEDQELVAGWGWYLMTIGYVGAMTGRGSGKRTVVLLHRLIMGSPAGEQIDHINGNKLDNRRANLRIATPRQNTLNRWRISGRNKSGIVGVCQNGTNGLWRATISVGGRQVHLGNFRSISQAARARWEAEIRYRGELMPVSKMARDEMDRGHLR